MVDGALTTVDDLLKEVCLSIEQRYEVNFLEIGTDKDHAAGHKNAATNSLTRAETVVLLKRAD